MSDPRSTFVRSQHTSKDGHNDLLSAAHINQLHILIRAKGQHRWQRESPLNFHDLLKIVMTYYCAGQRITSPCHQLVVFDKPAHKCAFSTPQERGQIFP